jgi:hypothetical protein
VKYVLQSPYSTQRREASDAGRVRLAITGGAAFVGTNLALAALDCGHEVFPI